MSDVNKQSERLAGQVASRLNITVKNNFVKKNIQRIMEALANRDMEALKNIMAMQDE